LTMVREAMSIHNIYIITQRNNYSTSVNPIEQHIQETNHSSTATATATATATTTETVAAVIELPN